MISALLIALALATPSDTLIRGSLGKLIPGPDGGAPVPIFQAPFAATGPLIEEDANTLVHLYWNGSALVDVKGNGWAMQGTVPQNVSSPLYPNFAEAPRKGAGPFSVANYYSVASHPVNAGAGFMLCAVYKLGPVSSGMILYDDRNGTTNGFYVWVNTSGQFSLNSAAAGCTAATVLTGVQEGIAVGCAGRSGNQGSASVNGSSVVTDATCTALTLSTSAGARIGLSETGTSPALGAIYEIYATSSSWNATTAAQIQAKILGQYALDKTAPTTPVPLTVSRSSTATLEQPTGSIWYYQANTTRVGASGALIEPVASNYHPSSSGPCTTGNAWGTGWITYSTGTCTNNTSTAPDNIGSWDTLNASASALYGLVTGSGLNHAVSTWVKALADRTFTIVAQDNGTAITACTCLTSDGRACSTSIASGDCTITVTANTTPVRVSATITGGAQNWYYFQAPAGGAVDVWGIQVEALAAGVNTAVSSYIPTTTTATTRQAELIYAALPTAAKVDITVKPPVCFDATVTPFVYPWNLTPHSALSTDLTAGVRLSTLGVAPVAGNSRATGMLYEPVTIEEITYDYYRGVTTDTPPQTVIDTGGSVSHRLSTYYDPDYTPSTTGTGYPRLYIDGVEFTSPLITTGAEAEPVSGSYLGNLRIGNDGTVWTNGYIKHARLFRTTCDKVKAAP